MPIRSRLIARQDIPYNAEPTPEDLSASLVTPVRHFFVRNHGAVPKLDGAGYVLRVKGLVERPLTLNLARLRHGFPQARVAAVLQCAGNRRREHSLLRQIEGVPWDACAIGNAQWAGPRLADIISAAGPLPGAKHVWFNSVDRCSLSPGRRVRFGASIPIDKAREPETIIALRMNGRALTPEHGFPARALVPGYIGARSVKWLESIVFSALPSANPFVTENYKVFPPKVTEASVRWDGARPLAEYPLNAAILTPLAGERVRARSVSLRGYAVAPGKKGAGLAQVEISADDGRSWILARLTEPGERFAWVLWEAKISLSPGRHTLLCRATDSSGRAQPRRARWNFMGFNYDGWHRVPVVAA